MVNKKNKRVDQIKTGIVYSPAITAQQKSIIGRSLYFPYTAISKETTFLVSLVAEAEFLRCVSFQAYRPRIGRKATPGNIFTSQIPSSLTKCFDGLRSVYSFRLFIHGCLSPCVFFQYVKDLVVEWRGRIRTCTRALILSSWGALSTHLASTIPPSLHLCAAVSQRPSGAHFYHQKSQCYSFYRRASCLVEYVVPRDLVAFDSRLYVGSPVQSPCPAAPQCLRECLLLSADPVYHSEFSIEIKSIAKDHPPIIERVIFIAFFIPSFF